MVSSLFNKPFKTVQYLIFCTVRNKRIFSNHAINHYGILTKRRLHRDITNIHSLSVLEPSYPTAPGSTRIWLRESRDAREKSFRRPRRVWRHWNWRRWQRDQDALLGRGRSFLYLFIKIKKRMVGKKYLISIPSFNFLIMFPDLLHQIYGVIFSISSYM